MIALKKRKDWSHMMGQSNVRNRIVWKGESVPQDVDFEQVEVLINGRFK
jgi:hypothetical protein